MLFAVELLEQLLLLREDFILGVGCDDLLKMAVFLCVVDLVDVAVELHHLARPEIEEIDAVIEGNDLVERLLHRACLGGEAGDVHCRHEKDCARIVHVARHEPQADGVERVARDKVGVDLASRAIRLVHHPCDHALVLALAPLVMRRVHACLIQLDVLQEHLEHLALVQVADLSALLFEDREGECIADLGRPAPFERFA